VRLEEFANLKHELVDGVMRLLAPGTLEHSATAAAITATFGACVGGRAQVFASNARVHVIDTGLATYPDVSVVFGPVERDAEDRHAMTNPIVLVEVTRDGTEDYDRGEKLSHYKRIPSLREVVIVSHRRPHIEVHRREEHGDWSTTEAVAGESVLVSSLECMLSVDDIFRAPLSA